MKIAVGWDHHGRPFRPLIARILKGLNLEMTELGEAADQPSDYPDAAFRVAESVAAGRTERGLLICGSGIGMCIAANKVRGVRAGVADDEETARLSRTHNDANVICLNERTARNEPLLERIIGTWLKTSFETGGRHQRRVEKIVAYENRRDRRE